MSRIFEPVNIYYLALTPASPVHSSVLSDATSKLKYYIIPFKELETYDITIIRDDLDKSLLTKKLDPDLILKKVSLISPVEKFTMLSYKISAGAIIIFLVLDDHIDLNHYRDICPSEVININHMNASQVLESFVSRIKLDAHKQYSNTLGLQSSYSEYGIGNLRHEFLLRSSILSTDTVFGIPEFHNDISQSEMSMSLAHLLKSNLDKDYTEGVPQADEMASIFLPQCSLFKILEKEIEFEFGDNYIFILLAEAMCIDRLLSREELRPGLVRIDTLKLPSNTLEAKFITNIEMDTIHMEFDFDIDSALRIKYDCGYISDFINTDLELFKSMFSQGVAQIEYIVENFLDVDISEGPSTTKFMEASGESTVACSEEFPYFKITYTHELMEEKIDLYKHEQRRIDSLPETCLSIDVNKFKSCKKMATKIENQRTGDIRERKTGFSTEDIVKTINAENEYQQAEIKKQSDVCLKSLDESEAEDFATATAYLKDINVFCLGWHGLVNTDNSGCYNIGIELSKNDAYIKELMDKCDLTELLGSNIHIEYSTVCDKAQFRDNRRLRELGIILTDTKSAAYMISDDVIRVTALIVDLTLVIYIMMYFGPDPFILKQRIPIGKSLLIDWFYVRSALAIGSIIVVFGLLPMLAEHQFNIAYYMTLIEMPSAMSCISDMLLDNYLKRIDVVYSGGLATTSFKMDNCLGNQESSIRSVIGEYIYSTDEDDLSRFLIRSRDFSIWSPIKKIMEILSKTILLQYMKLGLRSAFDYKSYSEILGPVEFMIYTRSQIRYIVLSRLKRHLMLLYLIMIMYSCSKVFLEEDVLLLLLLLTTSVVHVTPKYSLVY